MDYRLVGTIKGEGWEYSVLHSPEGYSVDIGGAVGITDPQEYEDDVTAMRELLRIVTSEIEEAAR